jgi:hypothetical protein
VDQGLFLFFLLRFVIPLSRRVPVSVPLMFAVQASVETFADSAVFMAALLHAQTTSAVLAQMQATVDGLGSRHEALQAALAEARRQLLIAEKEAEAQKNQASVGCARDVFNDLDWMVEMERACGELTVGVIDAKTLEVRHKSQKRRSTCARFDGRGNDCS